MSISTALNNAVSGLTAASRSAELVSSNVANAMTESYGRREIALGTRTIGGAGAGVSVLGVNRVVDQAILQDRRLADASVGQRQTLSDYANRIGELVGVPEDASSLAGRIVSFEQALASASSRPDSDIRLSGVLETATALAREVERISDGVQAERMDADSGIARQVDDLNRALTEVADLNAAILRLSGGDRDATGLLDQRQAVIDRITSIVPIRSYVRDNGAVALYTVNGATLLESRPAKIAFEASGVITPDMTLASGALSGLTINGQPVRTSGDFAPIAGGSLAALFDIRDSRAPGAQAQIDSLARDLIGRFSDPATDPTLAGAPGLFTDGGGSFDPATETGIAGRLSVNTLADPARGGALWRLRDGLGAVAAGPPGDATQLNRLTDAMTRITAPASSAITSVPMGLAALGAELQSRVARAGLSAETELGFAAARQVELEAAERRGGVDTDQEMQKLLLIERTYAANARVISTIDDLLNRLLEI